MKLSALTSSLPMDLPAAIAVIAELGFEWIDTPPTANPAALGALQERNLRVACVGLERDQPPGVDLASDDDAIRRNSLDYFRRAIAQTAELRAPAAYLTPPLTDDEETFPFWLESVIALADCAQTHDVKLCIEHFPGRALATVAETLRFLDDMQHPALALLIDVGHCLISKEDPAKAIVAAGPRLGYVHFDDNDGAGDLHWALLDGKLTEAQIRGVLKSLQSQKYAGAVCIELNPGLDEPLENLRRSREILLRCGEKQ